MIYPDTLAKIYAGNFSEQLQLAVALLHSILQQEAIIFDSELKHLFQTDANPTISSELNDLSDDEKIELVIHILVFLKVDISTTGNRDE